DAALRRHAGEPGRAFVVIEAVARGALPVEAQQQIRAIRVEAARAARARRRHAHLRAPAGALGLERAVLVARERAPGLRVAAPLVPRALAGTDALARAGHGALGLVPPAAVVATEARGARVRGAAAAARAALASAIAVARAREGAAAAVF